MAVKSNKVLSILEKIATLIKDNEKFMIGKIDISKNEIENFKPPSGLPRTILFSVKNKQVGIPYTGKYDDEEAIA